MRRSIIIGLSLLVLLGAVVVVLLRNEDSGPLPSAKELRTNGFAVWPEDTLDEGMEACQDAESWRLDPQETAFRFTREVLKYPDPGLNTGPIGDEESPNKIRYIIGSKGVRGVFLGSVIDVRKYDRCWFVVHLEPREGGGLPSIGALYSGEDLRLVMRLVWPDVRIGFGSWEKKVEGERGQIVLDVPDLEEANATGHVMALAPFRQVLDGSASPLPGIPDPASGEVTDVPLREVSQTPRICGDDPYRHPNSAIEDLYTFTLRSPVGRRDDRITFPRGEGAKPLSRHRWLLRVDGIELEARIPELRGGCRRVLSIDDGGPRILRSIRVSGDHFTFELDWRKATSAELWLLSASGRGGGGTWRFEPFDGPLTLSAYQPVPTNEPFHVTIILRDEGKVVGAERRWYRTD